MICITYVTIEIILQIFVLLDCIGDQRVDNRALYKELVKLDEGLTQGQVNHVLQSLQADTHPVDFDEFLYKIAQLGVSHRTYTLRFPRHVVEK